MTLRGIIHYIAEIQKIKEYDKQEFVLLDNSNDQYPQYISFELFGKSVEQIKGIKPGMSVTVSFDIRGREWTRNGETKYFNTLSCYKIETKEARQIIDEHDEALINSKAMTDRGERQPVPDMDLPF